MRGQGPLSVAGLVLGAALLTATAGALEPSATASGGLREAPLRARVTLQPPAVSPRPQPTLTAEQERLVAEKERARLNPAPPPPSWEERSQPYRQAATWALFLGTGALAGWNAWRGLFNGGQANGAPDQRLVAGAVALLLSPAVLWSASRWLALAPDSTRAPGVLALGVLFPAGWLLSGAAVRSRGSVGRGIVHAAALYFAAGAVLPVTLNALFSDRLASPVASLELLQTLALMAPIWPVYVAFLTGLFGLGPN